MGGKSHRGATLDRVRGRVREVCVDLVGVDAVLDFEARADLLRGVRVEGVIGNVHVGGLDDSGVEAPKRTSEGDTGTALRRMNRGGGTFLPLLPLVGNVGSGGRERSSASLDEESDSTEEFVAPKHESIELEEA